MIKKHFKKVLQHIDYFWEFLNTPTEYNCNKCSCTWCKKYPVHWYCHKKIEMEQTKEQIKELINILPFIMSSFVIMVITVTAQKIENDSGTGFIFVAYVYIFIVWVIVILNINKVHKYRSLHNLKENIQQLHV